ncbi:MAG: DNA phosphorothioation-associated putative methyltransferase [Solirubrobacteraceae bacterium MAG38_C4-C5]|nr:DNA phosphorothioation-associated putative methyltransferase [Candidatus Siliceabacter maunaloa]
MARAVEDGLVTASATVFDYGCGRGGDLKRLARLGVSCSGYDLNHRPDAPRTPAQVVNLGFVVNVIENPAEREQTLRAAWSLAQHVLIVAARLSSETRDLEGEDHTDGLRTSTGTFQKLYGQQELRTWIEHTLQRHSVAAAPGIFYVFREQALEQALLARRVRHTGVRPRVSQALLEQHEEMLRSLMAFYEQRGRLPRSAETPEYAQLCEEFGSPRAAFAVIRRLTGDEPWDRVRVGRTADLLVYLALSRFGRRARPSELPDDLRFDIRDLFGSHKRACEQADRLLFAIAEADRVKEACRAAPVGKKLPTSLYVHVDALGELAPVLRVIEGAARALIGQIEEATLVKIHTDQPAISYLDYPDFNSDPHPALRSGYIVRLDSLRADYRDYSRHTNPPILHRKETLVASDDPRRAKFERLTRQEVRARLYDVPARIGTRNGWSAVLAERGFKLAGHRLVRG